MLAGIYNTIAFGTYTAIVGVVLLTFGSISGAYGGWGWMGNKAANVVLAPAVTASAPIREAAAPFLISEVDVWCEVARGVVPVFMHASTPIAPANASQEQPLLASQKRRCKPLQDSLPPNTTAWCNSSNSTETPAFDAYFDTRYTAFWNTVRFIYVLCFLVVAWALRSYIGAVAYWLFVKQIFGTVAFIVHDVMTRNGLCRNGQAHAYSGAPTGAASAIYFALDVTKKAASTLFGGAVVTGTVVLDLLQKHTRPPQLQEPPAAASGTGKRRTGAGEEETSFDDILVYARRQGFAMQQVYGQPGGDSAVLEKAMTAALLAHETTAWMMQKEPGDSVPCGIGIPGMQQKEAVAVYVALSKTVTGHPYVWIWPCHGGKKHKVKLYMLELAALQYGPPPRPRSETQRYAPIDVISEEQLKVAQASADTPALAVIPPSGDMAKELAELKSMMAALTKAAGKPPE